MNVEELKKALKNRKRIDPTIAWKNMCVATENNELLVYIWKIPNIKYANWYKEYNIRKKCQTTLNEETTYVVFSGEKAFDSRMGGYSIFAQSIGSMKRKEVYGVLDRIERLPCEYAIDITDLYRKEMK